MSISLQFNYPIQNETAKKAMDSYVGYLEKAFEQYRDLWENYIKLQEKHEQCKISSSSQMTIIESCAKTKDEPTVEGQLNSSIIVEDSDDNSLLELDSSHTNAQNFFDDVLETDFANLRDFLDSSSSKSPVFSKDPHPKTSNISAKKFTPLSEAASVCSKSTADTKMFHNEKTLSSKCEQKLEISTTYHVETTFLPNGKKLKQSRLMFHPVKHDKEKIPVLDVNKLRPVGTMQKPRQNLKDTLVTEEPIITRDNAIVANKTFFEDVTEISPTQRDTQSKSRHCLKLKRKLPKQTIRNSPDKNKHHNLESNFARKTTIDDMNLNLSPLPEFIFTQVTHDESLAKNSNMVNALKYNINIDNPTMTHKSSKADVTNTKSIDNRGKSQIIKDKVQNISRNLNDSYEEETFYLSAEQTANKNDTDNFTLDDAENKPPAKKPLLNKFHVSSKKKENVSGQLNLRCKADRAKLNGRDCWECEEYYKNLSLSKEELQKRKNQCSRHRQKYERPNTPEGFWDPEFPETLSCTYRHNIK